MPKIESLNKIVGKAKELREQHRERHRPTGFGFALSDSIDYLDAAHWDGLTAAHSVFLARPYLRVLETAGPKNVQQRYALIFRGREAVAAVAAQTVTVSAALVPKTETRRAVTAPLKRLEERLLVCGNLLSWGMHGVAFAPSADRSQLWPAVAEALYRLRCADRLLGNTDLIMVKDVHGAHTEAEALKRFSYRPLETEPNMELELAPQWRSFDDYLSSLRANYRKTARQINKDVEAAGCCVEPLTDFDRHGAALHKLYLQVHERQRLRLVTLTPQFIPTLAGAMGEGFRCTVVRRDDQLLGFVTTLRDGETAVGYYIGFDGAANQTAPLYFRLLQAVIEDALALGCRRVSLGRTALEPKARLGARPVPLQVWVRHRIPALNLLVRGLLQNISHEEAPERNPFK